MGADQDLGSEVEGMKQLDERRQRATVGRVGPSVWVEVAAEKAVLSVTQFGTGGE